MTRQGTSLLPQPRQREAIGASHLTHGGSHRTIRGMGVSTNARACTAAVALTFFGCASARLILEKPVAEQCESAGLKGCPELTDGTLLLVDGNDTEGLPKIEDAARANEPSKVQEFAAHLEMLSKLPGAESFADPIHKVAALLASSSEKQPAKVVPPVRSLPSMSSTPTRPEASSHATPIPVELTDDGLSPAQTSDPANIEGGTVVPALENGAIACQVDPLVPGLPPTPALCLNAAIGPLMVTDLHASGACASDLFVVDGPPGAPRWTLQSPAHTPLHVTGARLAARKGETVVFAVVASAKSRPDAKCAVTWSGSRP